MVRSIHYFQTRHEKILLFSVLRFLSFVMILVAQIVNYVDPNTWHWNRDFMTITNLDGIHLVSDLMSI